MKKVRKITEFVLGCSLIGLSGLIYTFERFLSIIYWVGQFAPHVISNSGGSWYEKPQMPSFFDNLFVPLLFVIGIIIIIMSFFNYKNDNIE